MGEQKKRVGLVTCFLDNCGACLQALALQEVICELGYDCQIVRFLEPAGYDKDQKFIRKIMSDIKKIRRYGIAKYTTNRKRHKKFDTFRKKNLRFYPLNYKNSQRLYDNPPKCDAFVCGSDQIWNPMFYRRNNPIYHLDFVPKGASRIAYAPSIGLSKIPDEYKDIFASYVKNYDHISIREDRGSEIVKELTGRECRVVLDPTLLIDGASWRHRLNIVENPKEYILLYLFGERDYIGEFLDYIKQKTDLPVICIPFCDRDWKSDYIQRPTADPKEFAELVYNAKLVITDSLHATAFSINFQKPFWALLRDEPTAANEMNSRITSMLKMVGLESRLIASEEEFPVDLFLPIDYSGCYSYIQKKRREDIAFLHNALEGMAE